MALALSQELQEGQMQPIVVKSPTQTEWDEYKSMPRPTKDGGLSNRWKANQLKLPLLSAVARQWFCIPASSSSERAFSSCGSIVSCKRTRL